MSKITRYSDTEESTEKSFGIVFFIVFLIFALYPLSASGVVHIWALAVSFIFLLCAFLRPKVLILPNKLWFKLGVLLGSIIAPIFMLLVYFITVMPIGIIMRLLGKDLLHPKLDKNSKSYWIDRQGPVGTMKNQF